MDVAVTCALQQQLSDKKQIDIEATPVNLATRRVTQMRLHPKGDTNNCFGLVGSLLASVCPPKGTSCISFLQCHIFPYKGEWAGLDAWSSYRFARRAHLAWIWRVWGPQSRRRGDILMDGRSLRNGMLVEEILHHLECIVNNGINYQPQLVQEFFHQQYH